MKERAIMQKSIAAGEYLVAPGEDIPHVYYIRSGICRCSALGEDGNEVILFFQGPGSLFPVKCRQFHFALETSVTLKAITPVTALLLTPDAIQELVRTCPDFAVAAIDFHVTQNNMFIARQMVSVQSSVTAKVATFLYLYLHSYPTAGNLVLLTQDEVALSLGISRIQVARAYQRLKQQNLIATKRNSVQILDLKQLKALCSQQIIL